MKTLYINIDNGQIESTASIEVLNYNLLDDFFFYLGDAIVGDTDLQVNKVALIKDFDTPDNASGFDKILKQWEELKSILFGESPGGVYEIVLPNAYIDWLHYNSNDEYKKIYSLKYSDIGGNVVSIDIDDFYTCCIKGDLLRKIELELCKKDLDKKNVATNVKITHSSLFIKDVMENLKIIIGVKLLVAPVYINRQWFFIDSKGNQVIPCIYEYAESFNEGLALVGKNGKYGFIDSKGNQVIPCIYEKAESFNEGLAKVEKNGKYGFIDSKGNQVISCIYDFATSFSDELAWVSKDKKYGIIDKKGNQVISCNSNLVFSFHEGLAPIFDPWYYFINKKGDKVFSHSYRSTGFFCGGLAPVCEFLGKWGVIDIRGNLVVPYIYDYIESFSEELACVKKNGKYGFIDIKGNLVVPCIYEGIYDGEYKKYKKYKASFFSNGLAAVRLEKNGKWGFIDAKGSLVIPYIYDYVTPFHNGLAEIVKDGKAGVINTKGHIIISCLYDCIRNFNLVDIKL